jgi:hypothetical protein
MIELDRLSVADLLRLHADILDALRARAVLRSANNPTGDLAEHLFCRAFGWRQEANSAKAFDATDDDDGTRYQIKGRRLTGARASRQLSAIRDPGGFDRLAAVLFDSTFQVMRAAIVPRAIVRNRATFQAHTNSYVFHLTDDVWSQPGVEDVTERLRRLLVG